MNESIALWLRHVQIQIHSLLSSVEGICFLQSVRTKDIQNKPQTKNKQKSFKRTSLLQCVQVIQSPCSRLLQKGLFFLKVGCLYQQPEGNSLLPHIILKGDDLSLLRSQITTRSQSQLIKYGSLVSGFKRHT